MHAVPAGDCMHLKSDMLGLSGTIAMYLLAWLVPARHDMDVRRVLSRMCMTPMVCIKR